MMFWKYYELCKRMPIIKTSLTAVFIKSYLFCYFLSSYVKIILKTTTKFPTINFQKKLYMVSFGVVTAKIPVTYKDLPLLTKCILNTIYLCNHGYEEVKLFFKIIQLWGKFRTAMVPCSRFIWITNSSNHRRVWTANLLHTK